MQKTFSTIELMILISENKYFFMRHIRIPIAKNNWNLILLSRKEENAPCLEMGYTFNLLFNIKLFYIQDNNSCY